MAPTGESGTWAPSDRGRERASRGGRTRRIGIDRAGRPGRLRRPSGGIARTPEAHPRIIHRRWRHGPCTRGAPRGAPVPRIVSRRARHRGRSRARLRGAPIPRIRPDGRCRGIGGGQHSRIHRRGRRDEGWHRESDGDDGAAGRAAGPEPARRHATGIDAVDHLTLRADHRQNRVHPCITWGAPDRPAERECRPARDRRRRTGHTPTRVPRQRPHQ